MLHKSLKILVDLNNLNLPLTKEIISSQENINIRTIGHAAHDKTTLVREISEIQTIKYKIEKERNITYALGCANA